MELIKISAIALAKEFIKESEFIREASYNNLSTEEYNKKMEYLNEIRKELHNRGLNYEDIKNLADGKSEEVLQNDELNKLFVDTFGTKEEIKKDFIKNENNLMFKLDNEIITINYIKDTLEEEGINVNKDTCKKLLNMALSCL